MEADGGAVIRNAGPFRARGPAPTPTHSPPLPPTPIQPLELEISRFPDDPQAQLDHLCRPLLGGVGWGR